ncbi:hypothetical protein D3C73_916200 [compost metagenome]
MYSEEIILKLGFLMPIPLNKAGNITVWKGILSFPWIKYTLESSSSQYSLQSSPLSSQTLMLAVI